MGIELHREVDGLDREWSALAERLGSTPFIHPGWTRAWWRAFGRGSLEILVQRRRGELVGVLPLRRAWGAIASPTNWHTPVFGPVAEGGAIASSLFDWLLSRGPRQLSLSFLDDQDPAIAALTGAAGRHRYRTAVRTRMRSPYLTLAPDIEESRLGGKRRREMRRRRRLLEERGELTFEVSEEGEALEERLEEGFRVEALGWKAARGTAIASQPATRAFYTEVARWAAARGWLRLCFLRLDGQPLAFDFALEHEGRHYLVKTGYDPAYRAQAPGVLLRQAAIGRAASLGLRTYEFLGQAEPTKLEWTDTCRQRVLLQAFRASPAGTLDRIVSTHGRQVARQVRAGLRR